MQWDRLLNRKRYQNHRSQDINNLCMEEDGSYCS
jgi:hypothetical protein